LSDPEFFELADTNQSFEQVAAYFPNNGANLGNDETEPQRVTRGSASRAAARHGLCFHCWVCNRFWAGLSQPRTISRRTIRFP
jgi:hypothetical protein